MADEITFTYSFRYVKGNISETVAKNAEKLDVAAATPRKGGAIQSIGTSMEALVIPADIGTLGYIIMKNLDEDNFVEIGEDNSGFRPMIRLGPGDIAIFPSAIAAPQARADTAAVDLEYVCYSR